MSQLQSFCSASVTDLLFALEDALQGTALNNLDKGFQLPDGVVIPACPLL